MAPAKNPPFLNGIPELLVLQCLRERPMYGYELVQAIRAATGDHVVLAEGVVYPVLHMLEREGALTTERRAVNGRSRIYYALTADGSARLAGLAGSWRQLTAVIAAVLGEPQHA